MTRTPQDLTNPERDRGREATEGESKDPEDVSYTMPLQGVLLSMHVLRRRAMGDGRFLQIRLHRGIVARAPVTLA